MTDGLNDGNAVTNTEEALYKRACECLPGGVSRNLVYRKPHPFYVSSASGCYVTDINGVKHVDFANNIASLIHGHAHPAIVEAVCAQIRRGTAFTIGTEVEIQLAELLCNRVPGFQKIRFVNSGTEAVMAMIKTARAFTGKPKIAKAEGGYHGSYDCAETSQSANPSNWGNPDLPNKVPNVYGTPQGVLDDVVIYPFNDIERTIKILDRYAGEIACVIVDPIPHRIGMIKASQEFVEAIHAWTRQNGALLAFDEVICFRVNYQGAQGNYTVAPDLTSLGKIIGGGFPIGAFAGRDDVMSVLDPGHNSFRFPLSGTFSANPVSMTAGRVAMEMFDRQAVNKLNVTAQIARKQIFEAAQVAGLPICITGEGSMFKIHFRENPPTTYRESYEDEKAKKIINLFLEHLYQKGVIIINSCSCVFSTVVTQKEIDLLSEAALSGFRHIKPYLK
ncbi:MAG: aspartate aminotransferase family protein [Candidatus Edwardsbacteria bacterium]|nr:aspartate aminotransferase family protein [Candidatus Edwardsbacteria bacterium]MBU1576150.1 aspartate aminotransferase family protein [Candidatus Edwardsbacteria bacterium]MBU2462461.1 aspartate aminotransferase family protein [Candidatus Edwardsbacteria bacterium]MBU2593190.1 aspartate aminotransferase family protein [Candidatus Edwardsbacteria bacterium]